MPTEAFTLRLQGAPSLREWPALDRWPAFLRWLHIQLADFYRLYCSDKDVPLPSRLRFTKPTAHRYAVLVGMDVRIIRFNERSNSDRGLLFRVVFDEHWDLATVRFVPAVPRKAKAKV